MRTSKSEGFDIQQILVSLFEFSGQERSAKAFAQITQNHTTNFGEFGGSGNQTPLLLDSWSCKFTLTTDDLSFRTEKESLLISSA